MRQDGSRALREAASLAPENPKVKEAFLYIQSNETVHSLQKLCARFALEQDEDAGKEAVNYLDTSADVSGDVTTECLELVIKPRTFKENRKVIQDNIVSGLFRESRAAKAWLAKRLKEAVTENFEEIFGIGDGSANAITAVVLDPSIWATEPGREACERDVFQLFLAKLMEVGHDHDGRALKGIARLLMADANKLYVLIDEETFDAILVSLDERLPIDVRSQATLATAKYLEASHDQGQTVLTKFITSRVTRHSNEDLVLAFSAATAVFPIVPSIASALFLTEGFVPSLIPLLEKKAKSERVEQAALDMLSAACLDNACREAISKHCTPWLSRVMDTGKDPRSGLAAVILAKIQGPASHDSSSKGIEVQEDGKSIKELVLKFKKMMSNHEKFTRQSSIEGLAYASVDPKVKEALATDKDFLDKFFHALRTSPVEPTTAFGALTLIDNLTHYLPALSEEQKRMTQLKAYANASKASLQPDPLNEDAAVTHRCKTLVDAGTISVLVAIGKHLSPASLTIAFTILLSLSKTASNRGVIAQQGGVKLLLQTYTSITGTSGPDIQSRHTAAHALARILISVDPNLVFSSSGSPPLTSAIRPLLSLLSEDPSHISDGPRDLLPTFEALLALTNLASTPSTQTAETIIRLAFPTIEELLLHNNTLIQRASTELVCNLMSCPSGIEIFADESKAAARRLHILLALADVDDKATRKAAGGALATVTEFEGAVKGILERDRGIEILLALCEDEDEEIVHRGVVCVRNIVCLDGHTGVRASVELKELRGGEILKAALSGSKNRAMLETGMEGLRALLG